MESQVAPTVAPTAGSRGRRAPSGTQYRIRHGEHHATITEGSAAVREYRVGERDVFQSFGEHEIAAAYHGCVLIPWPNRIAAGRYAFDGEEHQLAISEPERNAALHGLACWRPWTLEDHQPDRVALSFRILPSPGYPFHLDTTVEYRLDAGGMQVTTTSLNSGDRPCPYALGFHPYLAAAPGSVVDECALRLDVRRRLVPDELLIPRGDEPVAGGGYDFRAPRPVGGLSVDDAFTDVVRDEQGRSWARLRGADGRTAAIWADRNFGYWQAYSADRLPAPMTRRAMALEPMTAAPNAFNTGDGLIRLDPGESFTAVWGATLL
jgi:aldose 1-epimerase